MTDTIPYNNAYRVRTWLAGRTAEAGGIADIDTISTQERHGDIGSVGHCSNGLFAHGNAAIVALPAWRTHALQGEACAAGAD